MALEHRLQILLDEERHARIASAARERGVSVVAVEELGAFDAVLAAATIGAGASALVRPCAVRRWCSRGLLAETVTQSRSNLLTQSTLTR